MCFGRRQNRMTSSLGAFSQDGCSVLHIAAARGHKKVILKLIENSVELNLKLSVREVE